LLLELERFELRIWRCHLSCQKLKELLHDLALSLHLREFLDQLPLDHL
jgi:hypothetical protein